MAYVAPPGPASQAAREAAEIFASGPQNIAGRAPRVAQRGWGLLRSGGGRVRTWLTGGADDAARSAPRLAGGADDAARSAPRLPTNPTQAGDDVVRAVQNAPPVPPAAGIPPSQRVTPFLVRTGVYGTAAVATYKYAPQFVNRASSSLAGVVGPEGPVGAAGETINKTLVEFGSALGGGLADILGGAGAGAGTGVYNTLAGVGEGLKKAALPLLLLGVGFLGFTALQRK